MKKSGILHAQLSRVIAGMGHADLLVIGDAGLPVPPGVETVDLALREGIPGFLDTLSAVLAELHVESAVIDTEQAQVSHAFHERFMDAWPVEIKLEAVPHAELQEMVKDARAVIRTGEFTPYANIVLKAGVLF